MHEIWKVSVLFYDEFTLLFVSLYSSAATARTEVAVGAALRFVRMRRPRTAGRHPVAVQDGDTGSRKTRNRMRGEAAELSRRRGRC